jgi:hypothetical protein
MTKTDRLKLAHQRATAAWLALDAHTDAETLNKMIAVARKGRDQRKQRQRRQEKPEPKD